MIFIVLDNTDNLKKKTKLNYISTVKFKTDKIKINLLSERITKETTIKLLEIKPPSGVLYYYQPH
jgi:hypothetical protein